MKRRTKISIGTALLGWLLTLGFFHERSVSSRFSVGVADAWREFENGALRLYPSTWVNSAYSNTKGIPYLLHSTIDRPPYSLSFCFTISEIDRAESLTINIIVIEYEDGTTEQVEIPPSGIRKKFYMDERGRNRGETACKRVNFSFPDAVTKRQGSTITLHGVFESQEGIEQYDEEINLMIEDETYFYIGWIAFILRQI